MEQDKSDADNEPEEETTPGFRLEKVNEIVVWNEHNGNHHDSGTEKCNIALLLDGKTVWEQRDGDSLGSQQVDQPRDPSPQREGRHGACRNHRLE